MGVLAACSVLAVLMTDISRARFLSRSHSRQTRLPDGVMRVFSSVYSCPFGQDSLRLLAWSWRRVFSLPVTASKCSGLQQSRLRHRWSSSSPAGTFWSLWCSHKMRWITRSRLPGPTLCFP